MGLRADLAETGGSLATTLARPRFENPLDGRKLSVLVVDASAVVRFGFRALLGQQEWVGRCLTARTGAEALQLAGRYDPEVAIVDLIVAGQFGVDICRGLRDLRPGVRMLLMEARGTVPPSALRAAGASASISKEAPTDALLESIVRNALGLRVAGTARPIQEGGLTAREREVLGHIVSGATNRETGERMHLSAHTVKQHSSAIYRKLGVRNRVEATQRAQELGLNAPGGGDAAPGDAIGRRSMPPPRLTGLRT